MKLAGFYTPPFLFIFGRIYHSFRRVFFAGHFLMKRVKSM